MYRGSFSVAIISDLHLSSLNRLILAPLWLFTYRNTLECVQGPTQMRCLAKKLRVAVDGVRTDAWLKIVRQRVRSDYLSTLQSKTIKQKTKRQMVWTHIDTIAFNGHAPNFRHYPMSNFVLSSISLKRTKLATFILYISKNVSYRIYAVLSISSLCCIHFYSFKYM